MSVPSPSTTKARPALPILICDTTSQMNLRFTSATVTPPPPICGMAIVMYGSDSLRNRTEPRAALLRLDELRLPGEVLLAADHVHREPRHAELFFAGRVQIAELGDGLDLPLEPEVIDPSLLQRRRRSHELGLGRPAHLLLDLFDVGLDPRGGAGRLFTLKVDERRLVLLVREIDLDGPAGEQGAAHQGDEDDDVLADQPAARSHTAIPGQILS